MAIISKREQNGGAMKRSPRKVSPKKTSTRKKSKVTSPGLSPVVVSGKVKVHVEGSSAHENPIVVSFPGGAPESLGSKNAPGESPRFQWQKLHPKMAASRRVNGYDKHCIYTGQARGLGYDNRRTKLCVGVYDKEKGVVVLKEAASRGTIFSLQQAVPSYIERMGEIESRPGESLLHYSTAVFEDFGSAKKQKVLKSQAANRVNIDHVIGAGEGSAVMAQVAQGQSMSESNRKAIAESKANKGVTGSMVPSRVSQAVESAHEAARRNFLPDYDENAVKPIKVYSARSIAGDSAWTRIYNKVFACTHKDDVHAEIVASILEKDWFPSVLKVVNAVPPDGGEAKDRYTCAILVNWLIKFYNNNQRRRSIEQPNETKSTYYGIPIEVASRWISLFTTAVPGKDGKTTYAMSKQNRDKCVVHVLLLYMMAEGPKMKISNLKPVAEDMKMTVTDCGQMLRLAGCHVVKKGTQIVATLKTPLTFPPPRRGITK